MLPDFDSTRIIGDPLREGAHAPSSPTRLNSRDINQEDILPDSPTASAPTQTGAAPAGIGGDVLSSSLFDDGPGKKILRMIMALEDGRLRA